MSGNIAVITARGGSKRIPKKNIRPFCGVPIIAYSIRAALESGLFDIVMVSTDDEEIADIAGKYGAEIPFFRSAANSDDHATTEDAVTEVLEKYREQGRTFDVACCIYPTAPFITGKKLQEAYRILTAENCDTVFPVVRFSFPPQRGLYLTDGSLKPVEPDAYMMRSQDLMPVYHDSGQFYFYRVETFLRTGSTIENARGIPVDDLEVQDIDTLTDWEMAEIKYRILHKNDLPEAHF